MENVITQKSRTKRKTLRLNIEKVFALKAVKYAFAAVFGFLAALPTAPMRVSPFAVAAVAVLPQGYVVLGYLGAFFSYMTHSFFESAAPVSAMTAVMLFRLIFKRNGKAVSDAYIAPLAVFLSLTVTGLICGDITTASAGKSFLWLGASLAAAGASFAFAGAVGRYGRSLFRSSPAELVSLAVTAFILLAPTDALKPFGVSVLAVAATASALVFGIKLANTEALLTTVFFGVVWATGTLAPENALILTVCVMAARLIYPLGKLPSAACYITLRFAANLIFSPIIELIPQMAEVLLEAAIFIIIPSRLLARTSLLAERKNPAGSSETAAEKLKETAELFRFLSKSIADVSADIGRELAVTPESCASHIRETMCMSCELSKFCCGAKDKETSDGIRAYALGFSAGSADAKLLPRCAHHEDMKSKIADYMAQAHYETVSDAEIRELSTVNYNIVSDALDDISLEIASELTPKSATENASERIELGFASYKNEKELHSGDNCEYFSRGKYFYVIISDGMGSGKLASIDSGMTCGLLKRFLLSGFSFATSIKLANAAMKLKGGDESFATADICRIDTETGEAVLVKAGAAASYILSENRTRRLYAVGFPVGILNDIRFDELHAKLKKGDELIMMSDGALNNGDEWLETAHLHGLDPKSLCEKIVRIGRESYGSMPGDDITAVCIKLK